MVVHFVLCFVVVHFVLCIGVYNFCVVGALCMFSYF